MNLGRAILGIGCFFLMFATEVWAQDDILEMIEIAPGTAGGNPEYLTAADRYLYFTAQDPVSDTAELYRTDGTIGGTIRLTADDIGIPTDSWPFRRIAVDNTLFFYAGRVGVGLELFRSDGTVGGTALVKDINTTAPTAGSTISQFATYNGYVYFQADEGTGNDLYISDGTAVGTVKAADINGDEHSSPGSVTGLSYFVLFTAESVNPASPDVGIELFQFTPAFGGTHALLEDINPGNASSHPRNLVRVGSWIFFDAVDGSTGRNLWRTNGTVAGTEMVKDFGMGGTSFGASIAFNDTLLFTVDDNDEIWRSDGTSAGTYLLAEPSGISFTNSAISELTLHGEHVYFRAFNGGSQDLWRTDGTVAGTEQVTFQTADHYAYHPREITSCNGRLFFARLWPPNIEIYEYGDSLANPRRVTTLGSDDGSAPAEMTCVDNKLFFSATTTTQGRELYVLTMPRQFPWPLFLQNLRRTDRD